MVPGKSRAVTAALSAVLATTLTFGVVSSAGAATRDVAEAAEATKQATRALEKAKKSAANSDSAVEKVAAAKAKVTTRLAEAQQRVVATRANLRRAREAAEGISVQVDEAYATTVKLGREDSLIDVAAKAAEVAAGDTESPVLDVAASAVKAGLTGVVGPVVGLLDPLADVVDDEIAEADRVFTQAESREQLLRREQMEAAVAHRVASVEWAEATLELQAAETALKEATKAEQVAAGQQTTDAKAVKTAKAAADKATTAEEQARKKAAEEQKKKEAAERAAAARGDAAATGSRSAAIAGRVRPATGSISSRYGMRTHPITGVHKLHSGMDFSYGDGNAYAAAAGTVTGVTYDGAYGNMVTISHGGGTETRYAHLAQATVSSGQKVSAGQLVGKIGSTGYATGPHLHFEVLVGGEFINPEGWLG